MMSETMKRTPPVAPPRVRNNGSATSGTPVPEPKQLDATDLKRISKKNPFTKFDTEEKEDEYETELFNRIQRYYLRHEPDRVQNGVDHIVDWALANGIDALEERLVDKYGQSLQEFEEEQEKQRIRDEKSGKVQMAESFMGSHESYSSSGSSGPSLRERLIRFYEVYDPERLAKGVDDLVEYVGRKGIAALNKKLVAKFSITLEDFENGVQGVKASPAPGRPNAATSVASSTGPNKRLSLKNILRRSFRAKQRAGHGKLPDYVRPLLELFYSKYDPSKLSSGGVNAIYKWSCSHGLAALDAQLQAKYFESLSAFGDRMNKLREDLVKFYTVHDPKKLESDNIDRILRWTVRRGRGACNKQLRAKYGSDLDGNKENEIEPEF